MHFGVAGIRIVELLVSLTQFRDERVQKSKKPIIECVMTGSCPGGLESSDTSDAGLFADVSKASGAFYQETRSPLLMAGLLLNESIVVISHAPEDL